MSDENKGAERQAALHAKVLRAIRSLVQTDMNTPADMVSIVMGALGGAGGRWGSVHGQRPVAVGLLERGGRDLSQRGRGFALPGGAKGGAASVISGHCDGGPQVTPPLKGTNDGADSERRAV